MFSRFIEVYGGWSGFGQGLISSSCTVPIHHLGSEGPQALSVLLCTEGGRAFLTDRRNPVLTLGPVALRERGDPGVPLDDVQEVSNYVAALNHGLKRMRGGFSLSLRLIRGDPRSSPVERAGKSCAA
jgi:hypothetical protein